MIKGLIRRALLLNTLLGIAAAVLWTRAAQWIVGQDLEPGALAASGLLTMELGFVALLTAILRALHQIGRAQAPTDIVDPIVLMAAVGATQLLAGSVDATQAVWAKAATLLLVIALLAWSARKGVAAKIDSGPPRYQTAHWIKVGIPLVTIGGSVVLLGRMDVLMVGAILSPADAGIYFVALKIATLLEMVMAAVNTIAAPLIAGLHARQDYPGLERLLRTTAKTVFAIVLAVGLFVILAGGELLGFFGPEFDAGRQALTILAAGWALAAVVAPVDLLGGMTGYQRSTSLVMMASLAVNAALNLLLIPRWGIAGAATAAVITQLSWRAFLAVYLAHRLRINPSILPIRMRRIAGEASCR